MMDDDVDDDYHVVDNDEENNDSNVDNKARIDGILIMITTTVK